jgi:CubicO group peptidase (beta-lactamase class C family)
MRRRGFVAGAFGLSLTGAAHAQSDQALTGNWTGVLEAGSIRLRLRLVVEPDGAATLYSLDQGGAPIAGEGLSFARDRVSVRFPAIGARFEGQLSGDALVGEFTQGATLPLTFLRGDAGLNQPTADVAPLDQAGLEALRTQAAAPAMAAAARHRDGAALDLVTGVRRIGAAEPATLADAWHWGSITKSMTATLTAKLVEGGALQWDAPLSVLLPDLTALMHAAYAPVTMRHLFSHRSGLAGNLPLPALLRYPRHEADPRDSRMAYVRDCLSSAPIGPAETTFEYSNSGYVVAGAILETLLGEPWEALIRRSLFEPLGMSGAGFGAPGTPGRLDQPEGHAPGLLRLRAYGPGDVVNDNPAVLGPAGRVHAPLADVLRFAAAHRDRAAFLRGESWDMLHTPPFGGDYALGLAVRPDGALWHNGSNTLWYAEILIDPRGGAVACAAANSGDLAAAQPAVGSALTRARTAVSG